MIGTWLKGARSKRGWSQQEVAARTQLGQSYISKLERNQAPRPSWAVLHTLAAAFEIPVERLLQEAGVLSSDIGLDTSTETSVRLDDWVHEIIAIGPNLT